MDIYTRHYSELHYKSIEDYLEFLNSYIREFASRQGKMVILTTPVFKAWMENAAAEAAAEAGTLGNVRIYFDTDPVFRVKDINERILQDKQRFGINYFLIAGPFPGRNLEKVGKELGVTFCRLVLDELCHKTADPDRD